MLERLRADGALLGLISNTGTETGEYVDQTLERSGILHYFAPDLRIYSSVVGLKGYAGNLRAGDGPGPADTR